MRQVSLSAYLQSQQEQECLYTVEPSVHKVSQKKIVSLRNISAHLQGLQQIDKYCKLTDDPIMFQSGEPAMRLA